MYCHEPMLSESDKLFMCLLFEEDRDKVCAITFELIANNYRGLRDVDSWQRCYPWGGSAGVSPKRSTRTNTFTTISTPLFISSSLICRPSARVDSSGTSLFTESGKVAPFH